MKLDRLKQIARQWGRKWPRIVAVLGALANVGRFVLALAHHSP